MHHHPYIDLPQLDHNLIHRHHPGAGDSDSLSTAGPTMGLKIQTTSVRKS
jgi:hypothetical protein